MTSSGKAVGSGVQLARSGREGMAVPVAFGPVSKEVEERAMPMSGERMCRPVGTASAKVSVKRSALLYGGREGWTAAVLTKNGE